MSVQAGGISIHALLAESDLNVSPSLVSTENFYPRSPCGERQSSSYNAYLAENISIHALLAESDRGWTLNINGPMTISIHALLAESDAGTHAQWPTQQEISIHALLAESDTAVVGPVPDVAHFYPRSPCGERLASCRNH